MYAIILLTLTIKKRILVVDDEPDICLVLKIVLEKRKPNFCKKWVQKQKTTYNLFDNRKRINEFTNWEKNYLNFKIISIDLFW